MQVIDVVSAQPLNEPFVYLLVELESNATRLVRGYTVLLDPYGYRAPAAGVGESRAILDEATGRRLCEAFYGLGRYLGYHKS